MSIRRAQDKDIEGILKLLSQVLEVHAAIRPDLFISGTTKYTAEELKEIIADDLRPIYVSVDDNENVLGYAFCVVEQAPASNVLVPHTSIYIDDICVDEAARGKHVATGLFEYVRDEAKKKGYYELTLNVWEGNDGAEAFYKAMGFKTKKTNMEYIL